MNHIKFDNSYRQLPSAFFSEQNPEAVVDPKLIRVNESLAATLEIDPDWLKSDEGVQVMAGNSIPSGAQPIATVYAGHQFGNWNPQLGDGRAVLLGEVLLPSSERYDIQLKGSGPTFYSRGGDGRAPIGPVIREYIVSEAMHALGVPTSRSLGAVTTGEEVMREEALPGAVLTRVASSHIRFGTFQFFAARGDDASIEALADHVIDRHYPQARESNNPYLGLFTAIIKRTASLIAKWQQLGFIHGVMNTDNMLICGETIDYGPCAFLDTYHPEKVFSSIDAGGRYAYQNQPGIGHWNLAALAQCFTDLVDDKEEQAVELLKGELDKFPELFYHQHRTLMAEKIGMSQANDSSDELIRDLLALMAENELDYTNTFTSLRQSLDDSALLPESLTPWFARWQESLADAQASIRLMSKTNPVIIPRNHKIEEAIQSALRGDMGDFNQLTETLMTPFDKKWLDTDYARAPRTEQIVQNTFCGT